MPIALILAAGSGERFGAGAPKAFVELAGRPLVQWSVDALSQVQEIEQIVVAMPPGVEAPAGVSAVEGGSVRSESVRLALAAAGGGWDQDLVLVHDAARPLLTIELATATIRALEADESIDAAIAAVPMTDTVKRVRDGVVSETLERSELWAVQTPQVFRRAALERALDVPDEISGPGHRRCLADRTRGGPSRCREGVRART